MYPKYVIETSQGKISAEKMFPNGHCLDSLDPLFGRTFYTMNCWKEIQRNILAWFEDIGSQGH